MEFKEFLKEYKILGLAIAFIIGAALTALVTAFVNDIIMPLMQPILPKGDWRTAKFIVGNIQIGWGDFLSSIINFVIIAFIVFMIAKFALKEEKVNKK